MIIHNFFTNAAFSGHYYFLSKEVGPSDASLLPNSQTFGADSTAKIQAVLDKAQQGPITIYWDGKYSVTGLLVYSNTTIITQQGCGAIRRDNSNKAIFANATPYAGVENGVQPITDENIVIDGGIWNGNGYVNGVAKQVLATADYGFVVICRMYGVRNIQIKNTTWLNSIGYAILFLTSENILVENFMIDSGSQINTDGLDFGGYAKNITVKNGWIRCGDDHMAFSCTGLLNGVDAGVYDLYIGNGGPQSNVLVDNIYLNGHFAGLRMMSGNFRQDGFTFRNIKGWANGLAVIIDNYWQNPAGLDDAGPGNVGSVLFDDFDVAIKAPGPNYVNQSVININGNCETVVFRNLKRNDFTLDNTPTILISGAATVVKNLIVDGYDSYEKTTNRTTNHIQVKAATVKNFTINRVNVNRDAAANASKILTIADGGHVLNLKHHLVTASGLLDTGLPGFTPGNEQTLPGEAISFTSVNKLGIISGTTWGPVGSGLIAGYGNTGLSSKSLPAGVSGRIWATWQAGTSGVGQKSVLGFKTTNALGAWETFLASAFAGEDGIITALAAGVVSEGDLYTVNLPSPIGIYRDGITGKITLQRSTDGITWIDLHLFAENSTAELFVGADVYYHETVPSNSGRLVNPRGEGLTTIAT